ncbi:hypothetical protein [Streptomyces sp. NPDC054784]
MPRQQTFALRPLTRIERLWYRRLGMATPLRTTGPTTGQWVRHLPQAWTRVHRWHARRHHLSWAPCVLCARYYGGHQMADGIPSPVEWEDQPGTYVGICPACTRAGRAWRIAHPIEAVLDKIADEHYHGHDDWVTDCAACLAHDMAMRQAVADHNEGR